MSEEMNQVEVKNFEVGDFVKGVVYKSGRETSDC